jgi:hypothetical protein
MRPVITVLLFFVILIVLRTVHKQLSGFKGGFGAGVGGSGSAYQQMGFEDMKRKEGFGHGQAIGGRTGGSGAAYQEIGFQDLNEAELIYQNKREERFRGGGGQAIGGHTAGPSNLGDLEGFRGGGGEAIGGHTAGPNNVADLGSAAEFFSEQEEKKKAQIAEAFQNISPAQVVSGTPEADYTDGPADASLKQPRKPYNLLPNLPPAPRGSISCLNAACCAETDFEWRTNQTGNFLQRTNNYKREFPDNCSAPLTELNLAFYKNEVLRKT